MSLAELFGIKETWRQRLKRARRDWLRARRAHRTSPTTHNSSRFVLESLEPRLLLSGAPPVVPIEPAPGLVGSWSGDTTTADYAGVNNATLVNQATYAAGKVGQGFSLNEQGFSGADDFVQIADSTSLDIADGLTLEAWIYVNSYNPAAHQAILSKWGGSNSDHSYRLFLDQTGQLYLATSDASSGGILLQGSVVPLNQWTHVAAVKDAGATTARLYINGALDVSGIVQQNIFNSVSPVTIGGDHTIQGVRDFFNGRIDEAKIYNRALSAGEIQSSYNLGNVGILQVPNVVLSVNEIAPFVLPAFDAENDALTFTIVTPPTHGELNTIAPFPFEGLVSRWSAEGDASDNIGANEGTLQNGAAVVATGKVGQGFGLDGTDDFVSAPDAASLNFGTGDFSLSLWVNFNSLTGEQVLGEKYVETFNNTTATGFTFSKFANNSLHFGVTGGGSTSSVDSGVLPLQADTWYQFAVTRQSGAVKLYWDGLQIVSGTASQNASSTSSFKLGHRGNPTDTPGSADTRGFFLNGRIDEAQFYNRALSDTEVGELFNAEDSTWLRVGNNLQAGTLTYTTDTNYIGTDSFSVRANDGTSNSATVTIPITIQFTGTTYTVTNTNDSGTNSLREAITLANANDGLDRIVFNIGGGGLQTITPTTVLPTIADAIILDAQTQPGFTGAPLVELSGAGIVATSTNGLTVTGGFSTIRGLIINRFTGNGLVLSGDGFNHVENNYIGLDSTGTTDVGNTLNGINITGSNENEIGGTAIGTVLVEDIRTGANSSNLANLTSVNGVLFYTADDGVTGVELWKSAGLAGGTVLVKDIRTGAISSSPTNLTSANGLLFFTVDDGVNGLELWKSDGTTGGTVLVKDIRSGATGSALYGLTAVGNTLFFAADDGTSGVELWKSDGTVGGTVRVKDIQSGAGGGTPTNLTNVNGTLFFKADNGSGTNAELWKSDGTDSGTMLVKDIQSGGGSGTGQYFTAVGSTLFFTADDGGGAGTELWKSDGTAGGTVMVKNVTPGGAGVGPTKLTNVNGTLFFVGDDGTNGPELWKSDGTTGGTVLVKDVESGSSGSAIDSMTNVNGTLYFSASTTTNGAELWKSDGTTAGTMLVKDIVSGAIGSSPSDLVNVNGTLFFVADDGANGRELWRSNGAAAGTVLDKDIRSGATGSTPAKLTNVAGRLFFSADDGTRGSELWYSDGSSSPSRNVISGNNSNGIQIGGSAAGNVIHGNYIGTDVSGTAAVANSSRGIALTGTTSDNVIGGTALGERNLISGNTQYGIVIGSTSTGNTVQGNYIGTNASGTAAVGNAGGGISVSGANNIIGGTVTGAGNVISGNTSPGSGHGLELGSAGNFVQGNFIGTNAGGSAAIANAGYGIMLFSSASGNTIGGMTAAARNIISGNTLNGIGLIGDGNTIQGNYIGTDVTGTADLGNGTDGIEINTGANNTIGGTTAGAGNLISGNNSDGIQISFTGATGNVIQGNYIGTNATGTADLGNSAKGIFIAGVSGNTIGGTAAGARNIISGNDSDGIQVSGSGATGNVIEGNYIGTNVSGTAAVGNSGQGINIGSGANNTTIGGTTSGAGNLISGNSGATSRGIFVASATGMTIQGNLIGTDVTGTLDLGNFLAGIDLNTGANNTVIGGTAAGAGNIISGNADGIDVHGTGNVLQGNLIGTNAAGTGAVGNTNHGIWIADGTTNTIGGTTADARNLISGNGSYGVRMTGTASGNLVQGNFIGTDLAGTGALGNSTGVRLESTVANNTIGGTANGAGNTIAFNTSAGVAVQTGAGTGNAIQGNSIRSNGALGIDLGTTGVTTNDPLDADTGPNNLQNFPVLTSAMSGTNTVIAGTLNSIANTSFTVEFFASTTGDPSGNGEGQRFLGRTTTTTNGSGDASFSLSLASAIAPGEKITATATDPGGNTSEFSAIFTAQNGTPTATVQSVSANEDTAKAISLAGSDPNGDILRFVVTAQPTNGTLSGPNFNLGLPTNLTAGTEPDFVASGDFNGDANLDLVVSNAGSNTISVLLGNGTGAFGAASNFTVGTAPLGMTVGDFDRNGNLDLAVANSGGSNVSILLGDGTGSFGAATNFAVGAAPARMTVGDFNGDGKPDLAVSNVNSGSVSILLGTGTGTFATAVDIAIGQSPYSVATADLNSDGKLDLVTTGRFTVSVLLGDGTGNFGAPTIFTPVSDPYAVANADLNGDGKQDLVVTNQGGSHVGILLGTGTGSFGAATTFPVPSGQYSVAIADLNGDGNLDLALTGQGLNPVSILLGEGTGSFGAATTFTTAGSASYSSAIGDFNGDGKPDLAVANGGSGANVSVLLNTTSYLYTPNADFTGFDSFAFTVGDGVATSAPATVNVNVTPQNDGPSATAQSGSTPEDTSTNFALSGIDADGDTLRFTIGTSPIHGTLGGPNFNLGPVSTLELGGLSLPVATRDLNGDFYPDLAIVNGTGNTISVLLGNSTGGFGTATLYTVGTSPAAVIIGNANPDVDGTLDLIVSNFGSNTVSVLLGNGDGTFSTATNFSAGTNPVAATHALLNNDTDPDLVVVNSSTNTVSVLLGTGGGNFGPPVSFGVGTAPRTVTVADLDNDSNLDLIVANRGGQSVSLLLGDGLGGFGGALTMPVGIFPVAVAAGHVNGDGYLDLVLTDGAGKGAILEGLSTPTSFDLRVFTQNTAPGPILNVDLNSDGLPDVVRANTPVNSISVNLATSTSTFTSTTIGVGTAPRSVAAGDVNNDGNLDLVVANRGSNNVSILIGNGSGGFAAPTAVSVGTGPVSATLGFLNADANLDLVVANYGADDTNNVAVLLGNGNGTFGSPTNLTAAKFATAVAINDMDGDGTNDIVVANAGNGTLSVFTGNGNGTFDPAMYFGVATTPFGLITGDINADGRPDVRVTDTESNSANLFLNRTYQTYTPNANFDGSDSFTFTVNDGTATSAPATVNITITPQADTYSVTNTNDSGAGSFRQAIIDANTSPGLDSITFNILGAGVHTITPLTALPDITDAGILDGTSQPGYAGMPLIELNGMNAGTNANGFTITAANSMIRGFIVNRFDGIAISISGVGATGNVVQGNFLGTDAPGVADLGNAREGVRITDASGNTIGGTTAAARNIISGNNQAGIFITGVTATSNIILGNFIGTDMTGSLDVGNSNSGVDIRAPGNVVGGPTTGARNLISGNSLAGIFVTDATATSNIILGNFIGTDATGGVAIGNSESGVDIRTASNTVGGTAIGARNVISGNANGVVIFTADAIGNTIQGNFIGTNATGTGAIANAINGVLVDGGAANNIIGGTAAAAGNTIAFNTNAGINVTNLSTNTGNVLLGNVIHSNLGLGTDLGADGVTANDTGDADSGANNLQNFPVLTSVTSDASGTTVIGTLNSQANQTYTIELFSNAAADPSGNGEGQTFLGRTALVTDASGNGSFTFSAPTVQLPVGQPVTATATDPNGNTSEFSAGVAATNAGVSAYPLTVRINGDGAGTITSLPVGISTFAGDFTETYPGGTVVSLTAVADAGSSFGGWTGFGVNTTSETIEVSVTQAKTLTASFVLVGSTEPPPPTVIFPEAQSPWPNTLTFSWTPVVPATGQALVGYNLYVGYQPGQYGDPIFAPPDTTSITLSDVPPVQHYFSVTALTVPLVVTINDVTMTEGNAGTTGATFTVSLSGVPSQPVTVQVATADGTATAGSDYQALPLTPLTFTPTGPRNQPVTVTVNGDSEFEANETFVVNLSTPTGGAALLDAQGIGTITNDDSVPGSEPLGTQSSALLLPLSGQAPTANPDVYATSKNLQFATIKATGVLANDTDPEHDPLTASNPTSPIHGGTLVAFNPDGSFIFRPNSQDTSGVDSFTYQVTDGTPGNARTATATIYIAQESGFSTEGTVLAQQNLGDWTVMDEGTVGGASSWRTSANSTELGQLGGIGSGSADITQKGTFLLLNRGVSRADVVLDFNVRSVGSGAIGLMFRYQDANNYYRFSMDNEQGSASAYRRLVKVQNGVATVLKEQSATLPTGLTPDRWQQLFGPAYDTDTPYTLHVDARGSVVTVSVTPQNGEAGFTLTANDQANPLLTGRGYALYSEKNAGSYFDFVGAEVIATPYQLEVRTAGTGGGTVSSSPAAIVTPGASVVTYDGSTGIQLTAVPGPGSTFQNWTNSQGQVLGTNTTLSLTLTNQTIVTANFTGTPPPAQTLDIDANGLVEPLKDGLLILRYMFGFTGTALTTGLIGTGATRTTPTDILNYLNQAKTTLLDVDGNINGTNITAPEPLKDGPLILRYLFGFTGTNLTAGLIGAGAQRTTATVVQNFLSLYDLNPATNPVSATSASAMTAGETSLVLPSDLAWNVLLSTTSPSPIGTGPAEVLTDVTSFRNDPRFANIDGDGMTAVIIDTGIDIDHPFFGPDADHNGIADRIVYQWDFADNDADASDRNGHGSHIASLIGSEDPILPGVAPDVNLIVLKVFQDSGTGNFGYLEQALQWVIAHTQDYGGIDVVNLSLGDGQNWTTPVNPYGLADEFATLANDNILTIAASGNSFFTAQSLPGVTYPAADPNVLAIGAVWTQDFGGPWRFSSGAIDNTTGPDRITSFTQRHATLLDALSPGARLNGANQFGGTQILQGTSQAAGYFSGIALLAQEVAQQELGRSLTPQEFTTLVRQTGTPVVDGDDENDNVVNTGLTFPRVDLLALADRLFVNHAPSFAKGFDQAVNEDAGQQTVAHWATAVNAGAANETAQSVSFLVTNDSNVLFAVQPTIASDGTLTFTPAPDVFGSATVTVRAKDNGGTANGGVDTSSPQTFIIMVGPVNDAPSFAKGADQTVNEDAGPQSVPNWATNLSAGPANESTQALNFIVSITNSALFSAQPTVSPSGTLTYTPATDAFGSATVTARLKDTGGTANGGVEVSAEQTFVITVHSVNDAPVGTDKTIILDPESIYRFTTADFGFTDPHDSQPNRLKAVKIVALPDTGFLRLDGRAVAAGQMIAANDLDSLTYRPKTNGERLAVETLRFRMQDDGGTANGGTDWSAGKTITFRIEQTCPEFENGRPGRGQEDDWMRGRDGRRDAQLSSSSASWVSGFVKNGALAVNDNLIVRV